MINAIESLNPDSSASLQRALFNAVADGVLLIDRQGRVVSCNEAFCRYLGYERLELIGMPLIRLVTSSFFKKIPELVSRILYVDETTFEAVCKHKCGDEKTLAVSVRPLEVEGSMFFLVLVRNESQPLDLITSYRESLEVYRAAINTPALGFWATDMRGFFLEVNDAYVAQSGYSREELLGMSILDIEANERPEETARHIEKIMQTGYDRFRSEHRRKDGSTWPVEIVTSYSPIQGGRFFVFVEDISEKILQKNRLELASLVFETMEQAVIVTDAKNRIVSTNPSTTRITGYSAEELLGKNPNIFSSGRHDGKFYAEMWETLTRDGQWEGEIWDRRKDGMVYVKWLSIKVIYDAYGRVYQYVSVFSDITERKKTEEGIWRQANYDSLTGLPNRYLFLDHLEQEIRKAQRSGAQLAVLFIDLDRFKEVNDTLGHAKGDLLLSQAARRISGCVRNTDTIARLGGDEFTVILPDFGSRASLHRIVEDLIGTLAEPYALEEENSAYVTASIGIALYPEDASDLSDLLKHSDQAMYVAKTKGRNRFSYFTPSMQEDAHEKSLLTNDLRQALVKQQLQIYFQPIVDLSSGVIVKAEALLRWHHPSRGMVSPMIFIPLAEEAGLIHEIGNWVFNQSIDMIHRWRKCYGCTIQVSINKSPIQFEKPIEPSWSQLLDELELPGSCITVEITEGSLLSKSNNIKKRLLEFRNAGIEVSIDDFGTGFSALSYLHRFDIDYLKIDRSFISDLQENEASNALIEAIIVMAHKLGIKTIAEGVETESQSELLKRFGCDYAQGFLYAKPMPADDFERFIAENAKAGDQVLHPACEKK